MDSGIDRSASDHASNEIHRETLVLHGPSVCHRQQIKELAEWLYLPKKKLLAIAGVTASLDELDVAGGARLLGLLKLMKAMELQKRRDLVEARKQAARDKAKGYKANA